MLIQSRWASLVMCPNRQRTWLELCDDSCLSTLTNDGSRLSNRIAKYGTAQLKTTALENLNGDDSLED